MAIGIDKFDALTDNIWEGITQIKENFQDLGYGNTPVARTPQVDGIKFPSSPALSSDKNTFDYYKEDTWTPVISGSATAGTYELSGSSVCRYTRIGNRVFLDGIIILASSITAGGSGYVRITGLPFAKDSATFPIGTCRPSGINWVGTAIYAAFNSTTSLYIPINTNNTTEAELDIALVEANDLFVISICYECA
jgi:hypothetical protein